MLGATPNDDLEGIEIDTMLKFAGRIKENTKVLAF